MSRRVLVTGSEGFTGKYVCAEFAQAGWEVWGAGVAAQSVQPKYLQIDLLRPETLTQICEVARPDVVIHLAAIAFVAESDPTLFYQVNLMGTRHLLAALSHAKHPPECTILASSANVYGNTHLTVLSEESRVNPENDYAVSKLSMEYMAKTFSTNLHINIVRPFTYTGLGQNNRFLIPKLVSHFRAKASVIELGNIDVERDFSDVRDIARYYYLLGEKRSNVDCINFCSGLSSSLKDCLRLCSELTGHEMEVKINSDLVRNNEVKTLRGDTTRLRSELQVKPPLPLKETLRWMLSEGI